LLCKIDSTLLLGNSALRFAAASIKGAALIQFDAGKHDYMSGEDDDGLDLGIGPAVFKVWDDAIKGGWFLTGGKQPKGGT
jgi:hypothetical protein